MKVDVTDEIQEALADIFNNSERPDKMKMQLDEASRRVTIIYDGLDPEWFKELLELSMKNKQCNHERD